MERISTRLQGIFTDLELIDDKRRDPIRVALQGCILDLVAVEDNFGFPDLVKENEALKEKLQAFVADSVNELESLEIDHATQIKILRSELESAQRKLAADRSVKEQRSKRYSDKYEAVLMVLTEGREVNRYEVSKLAGMSLDRVDLILEELRGDNLVDSCPTIETYNSGAPPPWTLTMDGKRYLWGRDLLVDPDTDELSL